MRPPDQRRGRLRWPRRRSASRRARSLSNGSGHRSRSRRRGRRRSPARDQGRSEARDVSLAGRRRPCGRLSRSRRTASSRGRTIRARRPWGRPSSGRSRSRLRTGWPRRPGLPRRRPRSVSTGSGPPASATGRRSRRWSAPRPSGRRCCPPARAGSSARRCRSRSTAASTSTPITTAASSRSSTRSLAASRSTPARVPTSSPTSSATRCWMRSGRSCGMPRPPNRRRST
jgi:hypothetical protein